MHGEVCIRVSVFGQAVSFFFFFFVPVVAQLLSIFV